MVILLALYSLCTIFIFMFLRNMYRLITILPSTKSIKKVLKISEIGKEKKDIFDHFSKFILRLIEWLSKIVGKYNFVSSQYEMQLLAHNLKRTGSTDTPEKFRAKQLLTPLIYLAVGGTVSTLASIVPAVSQVKVIGYILWSTTVIIAFLSIYSPSQELAKKVDQHNERVIREMPRFIRTYRYSPEMDFLRIIEEYLSSGKSFLEYDFKQLVAAVSSGISIDEALDEFAKKINIPVITELTIVLKSSLKNKEQSITNLEIVESKIIDQNEEYIEKELNKRPQILEAINGLLNYALMLIIFVPMLIYTVQGMSEMLK